jgi:hypothetical protein
MVIFGRGCFFGFREFIWIYFWISSRVNGLGRLNLVRFFRASMRPGGARVAIDGWARGGEPSLRLVRRRAWIKSGSGFGWSELTGPGVGFEAVVLVDDLMSLMRLLAQALCSSERRVSVMKRRAHEGGGSGSRSIPAGWYGATSSRRSPQARLTLLKSNWLRGWNP